MSDRKYRCRVVQFGSHFTELENIISNWDLISSVDSGMTGSGIDIYVIPLNSANMSLNLFNFLTTADGIIFYVIKSEEEDEWFIFNPHSPNANKSSRTILNEVYIERQLSALMQDHS